MKARRQSFAFASLGIVVPSLIVALLVPIQSANAVLIITQNVPVTLNALNLDSLNLDVDLNGTTDFTFTSVFAPDPTLPVGFAQVGAPFGSNNGVVIDAQTFDGFPTASRLLSGATVSPGDLFSDASFDLANLFSLTGSDPTTGNFGGQSGILGLRFDGPGGLLFGFAAIAVNGLDSSSPFDLTIGTVGFNDVPGQGLVIPNLVSEPGSLSLLALAGLGLLAGSGRRRRGHNV